MHRHGNLTSALFTILDGHGGAAVAKQVAAELHERILAATDGKAVSELGEGIRRGYLETDEKCTNANVGAVSCTALLTLEHMWLGEFIRPGL